MSGGSDRDASTKRRTRSVLVVDDDREMCLLIHDAMSRRSYDIAWELDAAAARTTLESQPFDVVVTDIKLGKVNGLALCKHIAESTPDVPVIVITAFGSMKTAVAAIRAGAYDFITKPIDMDALALTLDRAMRYRELQDEVTRLRRQVTGASRFDELIAESLAMKKIYEMIRQVADLDTSVLVTGESGTGKELVARALHNAGSRKDRPFVAINCAAVPPSLLESELFGHVRGAFTDAKTSRTGLFVQADKGTLFLDEIGEMSPEMQVKLLRVLQERKVRPVGGTNEVEFDVRMISATNRDLETEIAEGNFREDFYYRINVVQIHLPPLRSRGNDILLLAQHFIDNTRARTGKNVEGITVEAAQKLLDYDWPGNVRELENCIERAVALTKFEKLVVGDLPEKVRDYESTKLVIGGDDPEQFPTLEELERRYIRRVLEATRGNKAQTARILGMGRRTLYRWLERMDDGS
ncbi:MAG: sigma-54 dependent transcriptional regulator [Proteobacteria bacterium]|nr:sigma-54 dependent transcriptional regulator [Pseudomonadota bacterium]